MCFSYITYLVCENCGEVVPGSQGYYNVQEHSQAYKTGKIGYYVVRDPPDSAWEIEGGIGMVEGMGMASGCLHCSMDAYLKEKRRGRRR